MTRRLLALFATLAVSLSSAASAQETFDSLGGTWWFKIGGKDAGAVVIQFSEPIAGNFEVENITVTDRPSFGFSRGLAAFFTVAAGQDLMIDSKGNPVGELEIADADGGDPLGTLTFEKGKPNKKFTKWNLRASFANGGEPVVVKLNGQRVPDNFPVLTGLNPTLKLSGQRVKSSAFSAAVLTNEDLGLPAYTFIASGPAQIDGVEVPAVEMTGRFMLTPKFDLVGLLEESSDFGTGPVSGKLKLSGDTLVPKLNLTAKAERKVTVKGSLTEPVEAVLSVTPSSFTFPAQRLDDPNGLEQTFSVTNVGADDSELTGSVSWLSGGPPDFMFTGETEYGPLDPNTPPVGIDVTFNPTTRGNKTAQILFGVEGGAGSRIVTISGQAGIAELALEVDSVDFDDTTVGQNRFETVTVHNDGDGVLNGTVEVEGTDFAIFRLGATNPDADGEIEFTVDPGDTFVFSVRFSPSDDVDRTGDLIFTGGGGGTIDLTGTGEP